MGGAGLSSRGGRDSILEVGEASQKMTVVAPQQVVGHPTRTGISRTSPPAPHLSSTTTSSSTVIIICPISNSDINVSNVTEIVAASTAPDPETHPSSPG